MAELRHPRIAPHIQTATTQPIDAQGRPVRNSNIFKQWQWFGCAVDEDVRQSPGDPDAVPLRYFICFASGRSGAMRGSLPGWLTGVAGHADRSVRS